MLGVRIHYKPKFNKNPILIAALPDMGNVAGLCLNFLVKKINAKIFAEIYSFWPPSVTYKKGIINYMQSSYKFYENSEYNILFFTKHTNQLIYMNFAPSSPTYRANARYPDNLINKN